VAAKKLLVVASAPLPFAAQPSHRLGALPLDCTQLQVQSRGAMGLAATKQLQRTRAQQARSLETKRPACPGARAGQVPGQGHAAPPAAPGHQLARRRAGGAAPLLAPGGRSASRGAGGRGAALCAQAGPAGALLSPASPA